MLAEGWLWVLFHLLDIHIGEIFYRLGRYIPGTSWRHRELRGKWLNDKASTLQSKRFLSSVNRGSCDWLVEVTLHSSWREKPSSRSRCFLLTVSSTFWIGANWVAAIMPDSDWLEIWPPVKTDRRWSNSNFLSWELDGQFLSLTLISKKNSGRRSHTRLWAQTAPYVCAMYFWDKTKG